ncbi:PIR Superfamily Protein [Plasmodium ovale wallikeri]|uniref:PIR Superfamily Protein n=1 Tax=Plasmodium ovale wallikeri TaxID=864142 RepID=A0A1A9ANB1_PLAOA|nr:PIR Superfamily Protein [Plasmodium ovale wallikeri]
MNRLLEEDLQELKINVVLNFFDSVIKTFTSTSTAKHVLATGLHNVRDNHVYSEKIRVSLGTNSTSLHVQLTTNSQELMTIPRGSETNSSSSSNATSLVSLPIWGILDCFFLLYRFTPLEPKFHDYFQRKEDIPINQDYVTTDKMLSNMSNSNNIYSENIQYNLYYTRHCKTRNSNKNSYLLYIVTIRTTYL